MFVIFFVDLGLFSLVFEFREYTFGESALRVACLIMVCALPPLPLFFIGSALVRWIGLRAVIVTALSLCAIGVSVLVATSTTPDFWPFFGGLTLFYSGLYLALTPVTHTILDSLPEREQGVASALNDIVREFGATIGVAMAGSAFNLGYRHRISQLLREGSRSLTHQIKTSPTLGVRALAGSGPQKNGDLHTIQRAVGTGWQYDMMLAIPVLVCAAIAAWIYLPDSSTPDRIASSATHSYRPAKST